MNQTIPPRKTSYHRLSTTIQLTLATAATAALVLSLAGWGIMVWVALGLIVAFLVATVVRFAIQTQDPKQDRVEHEDRSQS